jgi:hypothetical protein
LVASQKLPLKNTLRAASGGAKGGFEGENGFKTIFSLKLPLSNQIKSFRAEKNHLFGCC